MSPTKILFLPGASARTEFWQPVSGLLTHPARKVLMSWPGFGPTPPDPNVNGIDDLVAGVVSEIDQPAALIAQSMGGIIAILAALECPKRITHLVLCVTSGGIDTAALGAQDWRPELLRLNPSSPRWFVDYKSDLSSRLADISAPALLLWGDADPIQSNPSRSPPCRTPAPGPPAHNRRRPSRSCLYARNNRCAAHR